MNDGRLRFCGLDSSPFALAISYLLPQAASQNPAPAVGSTRGRPDPFQSAYPRYPSRYGGHYQDPANNAGCPEDEHRPPHGKPRPGGSPKFHRIAKHPANPARPAWYYRYHFGG